MTKQGFLAEASSGGVETSPGRGDASRPGTVGSRVAVGAEVRPEGGVSFRVWAPSRRRVEVLIEGVPGQDEHHDRPAVELQDEGDGYFSGVVEWAGPGTLYRYRLDGGDAFPDPASRFQPDGPHG